MTREIGPEAIRIIDIGNSRKVHPPPPQKGGPKTEIAKKQKAEGNGEKNIAPVKCYNFGKKGHYTRDCPEPQKVPFSTYSPKLYVCSHVLVANSLCNWIVNTGASKHIVGDQVGVIDFHC